MTRSNLNLKRLLQIIVFFIFYGFNMNYLIGYHALNFQYLDI